jgi:hypothetical protein
MRGRERTTAEKLMEAETEYAADAGDFDIFGGRSRH